MEISPSYFLPQTNKQIIIQLLKEFAKCFNAASQQHKRDELLDLAAIIRESE